MSKLYNTFWMPAVTNLIAWVPYDLWKIKHLPYQCDQIWRILKPLAKSGKDFKHLFGIWHNFEPTLAKFLYAVVQIFILVNGQSWSRHLFALFACKDFHPFCLWMRVAPFGAGAGGWLIGAWRSPAAARSNDNDAKVKFLSRNRDPNCLFHISSKFVAQVKWFIIPRLFRIHGLVRLPMELKGTVNAPTTGFNKYKSLTAFTLMMHFR